MKTVVGAILSLFFSLSQLYGQSATIEGVVRDKTDQAPLEFATVALHRTTDSTLANGAVTDAKGRFSFTKLNAGRYYLLVTFLGYQKQIVSDITLTTDGLINVGVISLPASPGLLQEIQVSGQKAAVYHQLDKQVYNVRQFQSAVGGTALDVLKNLPSVTVDGQDGIRVRGASGFLVLLNGKPVQGDATVLLSQLPANGIENIEILTTPSARYDADGRAGIINITTRTGLDEGVTLIVNAQGGLPSLNDFDNQERPQRYGSDATLNIKKRKWDISLGASYYQNDLAGRRVGDVNTTLGNRFTSFPSDGERSTQKQAYSGRATVSYNPTKRDALQLGLYHGARTDYRRADITYNNTTIDRTTGQLIGRTTYYNANLVKKQGTFSLGNLDYTHQFSDQSTISVSGLYEKDQLSGFTRNLNLRNSESNDTLQYTLNTNERPLTGYRLKADYARNLGKGKLEVGYQYRYFSDQGAFLYLQKDRPGQPLTSFPDFSGTVLVKNMIQSVYGQYAATVNPRLSYTAGLRYEYATRDLRIEGPTVSRFPLTLRNLFPSANLLYKFNTQWQLKAGYSRRVQRTTSLELNPLPEREHSETLEQGDPNLLPEFVSLAEAGVIYSGKKSSVFATLYYQGIQNVVNRVNSVYADTILNRIYTNAGNARRIGLEVGLDLKPVRWWKLYTGANLYDYRIEGSLFNNTVRVNNSSLVYSVNVNSSFQLAPSWTLQTTLNYLSLRATAQGEDSRFFSPNASVKKGFWGGRLSAILQWQNISMGWLASNEQRISTWGRDFYTTTNYIYEKDVIMLSLTYQLNQRGKKLKFAESEFGEKEF
ncbi:outer membrane receptor protein involved in Fe transport [Larkinella arboricola]|uniref:Outer membrane receptor protein involved in Fe transport n=1 Tax=Larkinella arboricola TaxID=643671 RepID=A0A327WL56_LARAB|nr:outer membrane beta-barrel family protein [Larkinella arboricola]RAJ91036.1 outer membrane receptor protein involved in Fe transport [Larkinella arboricola]